MSAVVVTASAGANAGGSPPTPVTGNLSNDQRMSATWGSGTSPTAGPQVTFLTSLSMGGYAGIATPNLQFTPGNSATAALGPWYCSISSDFRIITVGCAVAPTASQGNTIYSGQVVVTL